MKGSRMDRSSLLKESLKEMGIRHDDRQVKKLIAYQELLTEKNKTLNLIGPADSESIIRRHILDSISPLSCPESLYWYGPDLRILDLGSGGGLPGIPLSILLNNAEVTLLEKTKKKSEFLDFASMELSLKRVNVLTGRAEELARMDKWRESYSIVTARAVTKINILLELAIPFCNINGKIIFYKSKKIFSEKEASINAINTLGGRVEDLLEVQIPGLNEFRALLVIRKVKKTSLDFPRKFSQIKKKPI
jgi:16S rRNA (guanine527-N7)-methyltransferase